MSGGFGVHIGGCAPKIIVVVLAVGVVIALVVGILLGSANGSIRAQASGNAYAERETVRPAVFDLRNSLRMLNTLTTNQPVEVRR